MQSNKNLDLNPAINDIVAMKKGLKNITFNQIKDDLNDIEMFLRRIQAKSEGKKIYENEKGKLVVV